MRKGEIVLIPFPYTDLTGTKNRPALILVEKETDLTVSFITTQLKWREQSDLELEPTIENGLKKTSLVRLSKLTTIDKDLVIGKIGSISSKDLIDLNKNLIALFQLK